MSGRGGRGRPRRDTGRGGRNGRGGRGRVYETSVQQDTHQPPQPHPQLHQPPQPHPLLHPHPHPQPLLTQPLLHQPPLPQPPLPQPHFNADQTEATFDHSELLPVNGFVNMNSHPYAWALAFPSLFPPGNEH